MFQAVVTPDERTDLGQHYTSVPNILKTIEPLFLDGLRESSTPASTLFAIEQLAHAVVEARTHLAHRARPPPPLFAAQPGRECVSSASWSAPVHRRARPALECWKRAGRTPPGSPPVSQERLSISVIAVSEARPARPANCTASQFEPSSIPPPRRGRARRPAGRRRWGVPRGAAPPTTVPAPPSLPHATPSPRPSEPLEKSTPRASTRSVNLPSGESNEPKPSSRSSGSKAPGGQHRVEGARAVPLRIAGKRSPSRRTRS